MIVKVVDLEVAGQLVCQMPQLLYKREREGRVHLRRGREWLTFLLAVFLER